MTGLDELTWLCQEFLGQGLNEEWQSLVRAKEAQEAKKHKERTERQANLTKKRREKEILERRHEKERRKREKREMSLARWEPWGLSEAIVKALGPNCADGDVSEMKMTQYLSGGPFSAFHQWFVLGKKFKQYDDDDSGAISFDELELAINDFHAFLLEEEAAEDLAEKEEEERLLRRADEKVREKEEIEEENVELRKVISWQLNIREQKKAALLKKESSIKTKRPASKKDQDKMKERGLDRDTEWLAKQAHKFIHPFNPLYDVSEEELETFLKGTPFEDFYIWMTSDITTEVGFSSHFKQYDANGGGTIGMREIHNAMRKFNGQDEIDQDIMETMYPESVPAVRSVVIPPCEADSDIVARHYMRWGDRHCQDGELSENEISSYLNGATTAMTLCDPNPDLNAHFIR